METGLIIFLVILTPLILGLIYSLYQLVRNNKVYRIRINWIHTFDDRHNTYTYNEMFDPSKKNWFGLRYPNEKHFYKRPKI